MAYRLIYNPLVDYIRSHVRLNLCSSVIITVRLPIYINSWVVWCDMQAKSICICTYNGVKVGLLYNNAACIVAEQPYFDHSSYVM